MLDAELIKQHLRLDDDEFNDQEQVLVGYGRAAWRLVEKKTGRTLIDVGPAQIGETSADLAARIPAGSPANALALDDDLTLAMLLLVAHWDKNREAVSAVGVNGAKELPLAVAALIETCEWFNI